MRTILLLASVALCASMHAQELPPAPATSPIDLHLDMASKQMRKAAWSRETSIYWGLGGGLFTMLAADRSAKKYDHNLAVGLGSLTVAGFAVLQLKGAKHDRRASVALHQ